MLYEVITQISVPVAAIPRDAGKQVVEEYPDGSKVPDALLKIGFAYISVGDSESAETYLKQVVARYPFIV